ncbi:hypothetical protein TWF281_005801 [Arthrobotrys megalospora]
MNVQYNDRDSVRSDFAARLVPVQRMNDQNHVAPDSVPHVQEGPPTSTTPGPDTKPRPDGNGGPDRRRKIDFHTVACFGAAQGNRVG